MQLPAGENFPLDPNRALLCVLILSNVDEVVVGLCGACAKSGAQLQCLSHSSGGGVLIE